MYHVEKRSVSSILIDGVVVLLVFVDSLVLSVNEDVDDEDDDDDDDDTCCTDLPLEPLELLELLELLVSAITAEGSTPYVWDIYCCSSYSPVVFTPELTLVVVELEDDDDELVDEELDELVDEELDELVDDDELVVFTPIVLLLFVVLPLALSSPFPFPSLFPSPPSSFISKKLYSSSKSSNSS